MPLTLGVYGKAERRIARLGRMALATAVLLFWFLVVWGVAWAMVKTGERSTTLGDEDNEFEAIGLLLGLVGSGFGGYWLFARPIMALWGTQATAWAVVLTAFWVVAPLVFAWRWSKRRPTMHRFRCELAPPPPVAGSSTATADGSLGSTVSSASVSPSMTAPAPVSASVPASTHARAPGISPASGPEVDPAELETWRRRDLGCSVRMGTGRLRARQGKARLRLAWTGRRVAMAGLTIEASQTRLALELAHYLAQRIGAFRLITPFERVLEVAIACAKPRESPCGMRP